MPKGITFGSLTLNLVKYGSGIWVGTEVDFEDCVEVDLEWDLDPFAFLWDLVLLMVQQHLWGSGVTWG